MKIKKMIIKNFRCYKDEQVIDFNTDGRITLLYGLSGHGKTTLKDFINWLLYNVTPPNINDPAYPLYNSVAFNSYKEGTSFTVYGSMDFSHNGVDYQLIKETTFLKKMFAAEQKETMIRLMYKNNVGSWVEYKDDVKSRINEIVPQALSKYFFFSGEKNVIDSASAEELKKAIYRLFGLTKYENALKHIGESRSSHPSVLASYASQKLSSSRNNAAKEDAAVYFQEKQKYTFAAETAKKRIKDCDEKIEVLDKEIAELYKILGSMPDTEKEKQKLQKNSKSKEIFENNIISLKLEIGSILYETAPYLLLSDKARYTKNILCESAKTEKQKRDITYEGITKKLLQDILEQKICVCGKCVDKDAIDNINEILNGMPPYSWEMTHKNFVKEMDRNATAANRKYDLIREKMIKIAQMQMAIDDLINEDAQIMETLRKSDQKLIQETSRKLDNARATLAKVTEEKGDYKKKVEIYEKEASKKAGLYDQATKFASEKTEYDNKLDILEEAASIIKKRLDARVKLTHDELEKSIVEVYEKLSTRVESFEEKTFLKDNFMLRDEYKAGGQEVIDVYSYIIGMIKAIHLVNNVSDENTDDFPVIIDAPFSKMDYKQCSHLVSVIPDIVPQVAMLTKDFDESLDQSKFGNIYVLESDEGQKVSSIERRNSINEIFN